jgi:hypothetical protein
VLQKQFSGNVRFIEAEGKMKRGEGRKRGREGREREEREGSE